MPESEIQKRGGAIRWRTKELPGDDYQHIAIVRKLGKRGGRTIAGPIREKRVKA